MSTKYARTERERRFLLARPPDDLPGEYRRIRDWYVEGTRLRLRRIEDPRGHVLDLKLGQKYSDTVAAPDVRATMTNLYLSETEYARLRTLGGLPIVKRRYAYPHRQQTFSVDVFEHELHGLVLAEIEFETDAAAAALPTPAFAVADVTCEPFFTGGVLATVGATQLDRELVRWGCRPSSASSGPPVA